jgi:hypothetical protein
MEELGLSVRALTSKITSGSQATAVSTVWFWTKSAEGTPPSGTYTAELNTKIATALNIPPGDLAKAYDASRRKFSSTDSDPNKRLAHLRRMVSESPRETWSKADIIALADDILSL